jgi:hypothetical protein
MEDEEMAGNENMCSGLQNMVATWKVVKLKVTLELGPILTDSYILV